MVADSRINRFTKKATSGQDFGNGVSRVKPFWPH
jgi:hypothetical protein